MGLIKAYRKKHWVLALDADLATIPNPQVGDTVLTEDKKKFYYYNGTGWKTGLGYEFVPRDVNVSDKGLGDFTTDGTWKVNGLDLSGIVPVGAIAALIHLVVQDGAANSEFAIRQDAAKSQNNIDLFTNVANIIVVKNELVGLESDRLLDYKGTNLVFTVLELSVLGWFI